MYVQKAAINIVLNVFLFPVNCYAVLEYGKGNERRDYEEDYTHYFHS